MAGMGIVTVDTETVKDNETVKDIKTARDMETVQDMVTVQQIDPIKDNDPIMDLETSIAICGLVCGLCSYKINCPGCRCKEDNCDVKMCCTSKGFTHCFQCSQWPCEKDMHKGIRIRAFNRVAKNEGLHQLTEYLNINMKNGITYHRPDGITGDYDKCKSEEEVITMLKSGKPDPYVVCPTYKSKTFLLRLVSKEDATELLDCYRNPESRKYFNADTCTSDFLYSSLEEMSECIDTWLYAYEKGWYVRFSIVEKKADKAVGTIEIFGGKHGVLRIDILPQYEDEDHISEILKIADCFFHDFQCERIVTKSFPNASKRINAMIECGYHPYPKNENWDRENYYMKMLE